MVLYKLHSSDRIPFATYFSRYRDLFTVKRVFYTPALLITNKSINNQSIFQPPVSQYSGFVGCRLGEQGS